MTILFVCSGNTCRSPLAVAAWQVLQETAEYSTLPAESSTPPPESRFDFVHNDEARGIEARRIRMRDIKVRSAGLAAAEGTAASSNTIVAAREWGVDLSPHRARSLCEPHVRTADLICTMTSSQAAAVCTYFAGSARSVRVLGEFTEFCHEAATQKKPEDERLALLLGDTVARTLCDDTGLYDIVDPYGGSLEAYRSCANQIRHAVTGLANALRQGQVHIS